MKILSYIHLIFCNFYSFRYNIHTHCLDHTLAALVKKLLAFQTNQLIRLICLILYFFWLSAAVERAL